MYGYPEALVVSWIRCGGEPNGYDLCTPIAELNPPLPGWGEYYKRAHVRKLFQSLDGWEVRGVRWKVWRADPNYCFRVTVKGPIPTIQPRTHIARPNVTLMVAYGTDRAACQMVVERMRSIIPHDEPAEYMRPEVVTEIIDVVLPEADRGSLLLRTVTKSGCNEIENADHQNVTDGTAVFRYNSVRFLSANVSGY